MNFRDTSRRDSPEQFLQISGWSVKTGNFRVCRKINETQVKTVALHIIRDTLSLFVDKVHSFEHSYITSSLSLQA